MGLLPYEPRPFQEQAVRLVAERAAQGGHLVLEAPTGTGKTVILLAGTLEAALAAGRRVLYVTRTNSQQEQAIRELVAIRRKSGAAWTAYALQGRQRLCLKLEDERDPDLETSSPEELSHYCSHAKRRAEDDNADPKGCRFWSGLRALNEEDLRARVGAEPRTAEALKDLGRAGGFCSYEATKRLLPAAQVVVAPYIFAFDPGLRARLFDWWQTEPEQVVLVVDEAHNLPEFLRQLSSPRIGPESIKRALTESEQLHHPMIGRDFSSRALLEALLEILQKALQEYAIEEDGFLPPYEVEEALLHRFRTTSNALRQAADQLGILGEIIKDRRRLTGKVPRSALANAGQFLRAWFDAEDDVHVKLAVREPRAYLEAYCVDAAPAAQALKLFHATVHASGTLEPLAEYRDTLGLGDDAGLERFPSPFPPERLQVRVSTDLTTRYESLKADPAMADRLQEATASFVARARVGTAVFFPSHQLLKEFHEVGVFSGAAHPVLREERDLSQEHLMQMVHRHRDAAGQSLMAGVMGGRLSEGMDFPGRQLEALLIVGTPFPKPTARQRALFRFYEARHGRGWDYAVRAPAQRRLRQAVGRLIRTSEDRGFAIVLDERAHALLTAAGVEAQQRPTKEILAEFDAWQAAPDDTIK